VMIPSLPEEVPIRRQIAHALRSAHHSRAAPDPMPLFAQPIPRDSTPRQSGLVAKAGLRGPGRNSCRSQIVAAPDGHALLTGRS
jgi:hypothetical protein